MLTKILHTVLPDFCIGCERIGTQLCKNCRVHICFIPQEHPLATRSTANIQAIWSAVEYRDIARDLVKAVKYERHWSYTKIMAELMVQTLAPQLKKHGDMILIPVPLSSKRNSWRGFNQAEHLAKNLGLLLDFPVETHSLRRTAHRTNQAKLNREERQSLANDYVARLDNLAGKTLCLIDDVTTTGATLNACAEALTAVGCKNIYAATFAAA